MKKNKRLFMTLAIIFIFSILPPLVAQNQLLKSVVGFGGIPMENPTYKLNGTVGQAGIGVLTNSTYIGKFGFWYISQLIVGLEELENLLPKQFELSQNYPNPFNPITSIPFAVPKRSHVKLELYNILGQRVAILLDEEKPPGYYLHQFNASNLSSGFYLYRLIAENFVKSKKLILLK